MSAQQELLEALQCFSSPTVSNALVQLKIGAPTKGFSDGSLRCLFPQVGAKAGIAMTVEIETLNPAVANPGPGPLFIELLKQINSNNSQVIVVAREVGSSGRFAAHCGEVLASSLKRVGAVGIVTDGGVRDVEALKDLGMQFHSRGIVSSSGNARLVRIGGTVGVGSLVVRQGDILHADANGLVAIPARAVEAVLPVARQIADGEKEVVDYTRSKGYTLEGLIQRLTGGAG